MNSSRSQDYYAAVTPEDIGQAFLVGILAM